MRKLLPAVLVLAIVAPLLAADDKGADYKIDDYKLEWKFAKDGQAYAAVTKTPDATTITIHSPTGSAQFTPAVAEEIGKILAKGDEYFDKLKPTEGTEKVPLSAKDAALVFRYTTKGGMSVQVTDDSRFNGAIITRQEAATLAKPLQDSVKRAAMIDAKFKP
jgi:hypothetical protein